jgi:hypothetical protein
VRSRGNYPVSRREPIRSGDLSIPTFLQSIGHRETVDAFIAGREARGSIMLTKWQFVALRFPTLLLFLSSRYSLGSRCSSLVTDGGGRAYKD